MLLLIELSRLRIESFSFSFPFSSYHIMGSWVGIRVMVRELFPIFFASPENVAIGRQNKRERGQQVLFHVPEVFDPWHFESPWMAMVPRLKCVWSRQVRHSVHEPETYLHSKLLNLTRSVTPSWRDRFRHGTDPPVGFAKASQCKVRGWHAWMSFSALAIPPP